MNPPPPAQSPLPPPGAASARPGAALDAEEQRRVLSSFRLSVKLVGMTVIIVALLGSMVFLLVDRIFDTLTPSIRHDLEWKARHGVIELCSTADLGVIAGDRDSVAAAAAELMHDPDVVAIHVTGTGGTVFDYGRVPFDWNEFQKLDQRVATRGDLLIAARPVEIEGMAVGRGYLAVSTSRLQAGMKLRSEILAAGAVGAAAALLLALAFVHLYISPLLRLTAEAFRKLERTTLAALESARIKSEFLANMSHEIRTPMNGIMGVTKLAMAIPMNAKLQRYIEVIDTSARGLLTIINDVLDFSKIEAGKYEIHPREFIARNVIAESVEMFAERAREKGLSLKCNVAGNVPASLIGDADRIKQILVNLLGNAVKFTDSGEVSVSVGADLRDEHALLRVSVRDTGCGVSESAQTMLFQAFTQVDGSSVRQHGGTGLGLAIAKRLAELMGGEIGVRSEVGRGSEFWFTVSTAVSRNQPVAAPSPLPSVVPRVPRELRTQRPVLVVDDNEINRFVAVEHLAVLGYRADTVQNGAEAVEAVFSKEYAAVLMDCQMPVMDGYGAAREIRRREGDGRHVPIIAVTAHALVGERDNVMAAGMDDYIPKPVNTEALDRALSHWVSVSRAQARAAPQTPLPRPQAAPANDTETAVTNSPEIAPGVVLRPRLIQLFLRTVFAQLSDLKTQVDAGALEPARAAAHKLKGSFYAVGANGLADELEALRAELEATPPQAAVRLSQIETRTVALISALEQVGAERQPHVMKGSGAS